MTEFNDLRQRVKKALKDHNLLQREFAELAGISDSAISVILMGRDSRYSTAMKIESALAKLDAKKARERAAAR